MQHGEAEKDKAMELENLFTGLNETGQDKALHILRTLAVQQADTVASDGKWKQERRTI